MNILEGTAKDFSDLLKQYLEFSTYKDSNWDIVDIRDDSFYGCTVAIPMEDYFVDDTIVDNILIIGDIYLNSNICRSGEAIYNNSKSIFNILTYVYRNATVEFKEFPKSSLELVYSYLQSLVDYPDVIVLNGIENTYLNMNSSQTFDNYVKVLLDDIFSFCLNNNIKVYVVATPLERTINDIAYINSLELYTHDKSDKIINFNSILFDLDNAIVKDLSSYFDFGYANYGYAPRYKKWFMNLVHKWVCNEVFSISREECYVSFMYRRITSNSYNEFFNGQSDYMSEAFGNKAQVGGRSYSGVNGKNPFRYSGELISVGMHTSFDWRLWMCEQGQITCKKEEDEQINDINLLPWWQYDYGSPTKRRDIPVYPTTGCSWFTIADKNKSQYGISDKNPIHFYFTKDDVSSVITIRVSDANGVKPDLWQSITFGQFDSVDTLYHKYPLYVAGGNEALSPAVWIYYPPSSHVNGFNYDLNMRNPSLANSNLLFPTKFQTANLSNVRLLGSDGLWYDIYNTSQTYTEYRYFALANPPFQWGVPLNKPSSSIGDKQNTAYPYIGSATKKVDMYSVNKEINYNDSSSQLDPVVAYLYSDENDIRLAYGCIKNCYSAWSKTLPAGIVHYNDRRYLSVPNVWDGRLWQYPWYCGSIYWENNPRMDMHNPSPTEKGAEDLQSTYRYYTDLENRQKDNIINDRLVIGFGSRDKEEKYHLDIDFPDDYINANDKRLLMRVNISVENDNSEVFMAFRQLKDKMSIYYGDGTHEQLSFDDTVGYIKHQYVAKGRYTIDIVNENMSSATDAISTLVSGDTYIKQATIQMKESFIFEKDAISDITLASSTTISVPTIESIYFSQYFSDFLSGYIDDTSSYYGISIKHQSNLHTVYLPFGSSKKDIGEYADNLSRVFNFDDTGLVNLYVYGQNDVLHVALRNCKTIKNIYCSEHVREFYLDLLPKHKIDIYVYSINDLVFYGLYEDCSMYTVHVFNDIYNEVVDKYGRYLNIVGDMR